MDQENSSSGTLARVVLTTHIVSSGDNAVFDTVDAVEGVDCHW